MRWFIFMSNLVLSKIVDLKSDQLFNLYWSNWEAQFTRWSFSKLFTFTNFIRFSFSRYVGGKEIIKYRSQFVKYKAYSSNKSKSVAVVLINGGNVADFSVTEKGQEEGLHLKKQCLFLSYVKLFMLWVWKFEI